MKKVMEENSKKMLDEIRRMFLEEKHKQMMMVEIVKELRNLSGDSDVYLEVVQETADNNVTT